MLDEKCADVVVGRMEESGMWLTWTSNELTIFRRVRFVSMRFDIFIMISEAIFAALSTYLAEIYADIVVVVFVVMSYPLMLLVQIYMMVFDCCVMWDHCFGCYRCELQVMNIWEMWMGDLCLFTDVCDVWDWFLSMWSRFWLWAQCNFYSWTLCWRSNFYFKRLEFLHEVIMVLSWFSKVIWSSINWNCVSNEFWGMCLSAKLTQIVVKVWLCCVSSEIYQLIQGDLVLIWFLSACCGLNVLCRGSFRIT